MSLNLGSAMHGISSRGSAAAGGSGTFNVSGYTDFSQNAVGTGVPSDWTMLKDLDSAVGTSFEILADDDVSNDSPLNGQTLRYNHDTTVDRSNWLQLAWTPTGIADPADEEEVLVLVRHHDLANDPCFQAAISMREDAGAGSDPEFIDGGTNGTSFTRTRKKVGSGTQTLLYSDFAVPRISANEWHWVRLQRIGTAVKMRWWKPADSEPGTWRVDVTMAADTPKASGGAAGIQLPNSKLGANQYDVAYFAYTSDVSGAPLALPA